MESSSAEKSVQDVNYALGFNDVDFSDRVLRLEIKPSCITNSPPRKRRTQNRLGKSVTDSEVQTLHVSSLMLAAKSPFFYKLFKNGMKESQKKDEFTLIINASEKAAFMDVLNSVYDRPLNASSRDELMDVMMAADKFEVTSCMRQCVQLLLKLPMTTESAFSYLEFPSTLFVCEVTHPLIDAAKQHLSSHFSSFTESQQEEAMRLPLCGIEAVVGCADFQVKSGEVLLEFMLKWARKHYPNMEEHRDIITNNLLGLICMPCLSYSKLMEIVDHPDLDSAQVAKLVLKAISYKIDLPNGPNSVLTVNEAKLSKNTPPKCDFPRHAYCHRRVVFFDIKKQECIDLLPMSRIYSEAFYLAGRRFFLFAQRYKNQQSWTQSFGLFVEMGGSGSCNLTLEFSAMKKPSYEFERLFMENAPAFTETNRSWGRGDLFKIPWTRLMGEDDNDYIIEGVMHFRAQLTFNN